ncbi:MAG TPA: diaminopimelate epimerase [Candidatus Hydrogenedens sp.]|nr:diaminopimelate epimerase [Candidatus Hydrogenedens sp.]HOL20287.1 diaminopimelate epimerase [Candidatus Hydrogenedens sp.]HPP58139.1 diaminopimelate epimerase [Candidatus Hydrogenedens sp.]
MSQLVFTKMHGLGNDYLYIDARGGLPTENIPELSRRMSHRHLGAGADGIILILASETADFKMRIFNADGSEAETCGNGIRCFAKYVYERGLTHKTDFVIETLAGPNRVVLNIENGRVKSVRSCMGKPSFERSRIPMIGSEGQVIEEPIDVEGKVVKITAVNIGNPHAVIFVPDATQAPVTEFGPKIEHHHLFPKRTNVEFVSIIDRSNIVMRIWERGSGITMASGSGSCASALASMITNRTDHKVNVHLVYGSLTIEWAEDGYVYQEGPAEEVYTAIWQLPIP